ncbi:MAG: glutathione peroxidase [Candidatus Omnitrophica bacterium]|nr:glutathione peroxidase [Candidatus Omnitrophota bacterium]
MKKWLVLLLTVTLCGATYAAKEAKSVYDFTVKNIAGDDVSLKDYDGKVLLIVNVASKCGYTPQYEGLQDLYEKYKDDGLAILAFPANNFGQQEPGTNEEIREFCDSNYQVTFDMFSKISVKGDDQADLYAFLTDASKTNGHGSEIKWNFEKFLVNRKGEIVGHYRSKVTPLSDELVGDIEKALGEK